MFTTINETEEEKFLVLNDYSSKLSKIISKTLVEPAIILSKIMGFENVATFAIELIRRELVSLYEVLHDDIGEKV